MTSRSLARLLPRGWAWLLVLGTLATVLALSVRALQPPAPLDRNAPAERFSEGRARDIVRHLTEDIGQRVSGAPGHAKAADYLAAELRKLPGVEVELQEVADVHTHQRFPQLPFVYRTTNVLGRLPGKSTERDPARRALRHPDRLGRRGRRRGRGRRHPRSAAGARRRGAARSHHPREPERRRGDRPAGRGRVSQAPVGQGGARLPLPGGATGRQSGADWCRPRQSLAGQDLCARGFRGRSATSWRKS